MGTPKTSREILALYLSGAWNHSSVQVDSKKDTAEIAFIDKEGQEHAFKVARYSKPMKDWQLVNGGV